MRVAVLSDIHGFSLALDRVLDAIAADGPFAEVVVAGDLCEVGPDPAGVIARLRTTPFVVLRGNTDRDIVEAAAGGNGGEGDFVLGEIGRDGVDYLAGLPFAHRITPPGGASPDDDLLVVHANPHDLERKLTPEMSDLALRETIGETRAAAIAFGHHHVAFVRQLDRTLLVDVSAVGNPKDGDLRPRFGILAWDARARRWDATHRHVDYPVEETAAQIAASGLPDPARTLRKLLRASY